VLNQTFNELRLEKYPDKTLIHLIGRTERGFDFLGITSALAAYPSPKRP